MASSADALLLAYVEARARLASAPGLSMTLHAGLVGALVCEAPGCIGSPKLDEDNALRCSSCRMLWDAELIEIGKTEIGGKVSMWGKRRRVIRSRVAARSSDSRSHKALRALAFTLDQLAEEDPHATSAWTLHVLDDAEVKAGRANCLGLSFEQIPGRIAELIRAGVLPSAPVPLTHYRTRQWVRWARRRALELYEERARRTLAAATAVRVQR